MFGVAVVDILPGFFHAGDFGLIGKFGEEGGLEFFGRGAGNDAGDVHVRVAGAGKTKVDHADNFVVSVEQNVAEV